MDQKPTFRNSGWWGRGGEGRGGGSFHILEKHIQTARQAFTLVHGSSLCVSALKVYLTLASPSTFTVCDVC